MNPEAYLDHEKGMLAEYVRITRPDYIITPSIGMGHLFDEQNLPLPRDIIVSQYKPFLFRPFAGSDCQSLSFEFQKLDWDADLGGN